MTVLNTAIDPEGASSAANRTVMLDMLGEVDRALDAARNGGGEKHVTRHHARGRLLPRERIELLVDQDSPFLELSPVAAWGTDFPVGAGVVTGIGVVEGVECVIVANDPTVRGGAANPYTVRKIRRASEIALANRLPMVQFVEFGDCEPSALDNGRVPTGQVLCDLARRSSSQAPTISVVFGEATAAGAYLPALSDLTIMIRNQAKVFLAGAPQVQLATGEITDDESLGGAAMHASRSGLADFLAEDERDGIRLARRCLRRCNWRKLGPPPVDPLPASPKHDPHDLLALASIDPALPADPREVLARILDASEFDEFKPGYGTALIAGWGELHGYPVAVLADRGEAQSVAEAQKATQFVHLANTTDTPVLFLQNGSGYAIGAGHHRQGIVKYRAIMINTVVNSTVPHLTVNIGAAGGTTRHATATGDPTSGIASNHATGGAGVWDGATDEPLGSRAYRPRFVFSWPNAQPTATSPTATTPANPRTPASALFESGQLHDDGLIDPRDTRTVLGFCLSAMHSGPVRGAGRFGLFRM